MPLSNCGPSFGTLLFYPFLVPETDADIDQKVSFSSYAQLYYLIEAKPEFAIT
jgi:hypothetical protein